MPREGQPLPPVAAPGAGEDLARLAVFIAGGSAWVLDAGGEVTGRYGPIAGYPAPIPADAADLRVADARQVPELRDLPAVAGSPGVRSLTRLGVSGGRHGALVLADTTARLLAVDQLEALSALVAQAGRLADAEAIAEHGWRAEIGRLGPPVFALEVAADLRVVGGNRAAEALVCKPDEVFGGAIRGAFPWADESGLVQRCLRVAESGEPEEFELVFGADAGRMVQAIRIFPLTPGYLGVAVEDRTMRRELEQRREEFMAMIAHELRTPLSSVRGAIGLLAGGVAGPLPESAARLVGLAREGAERLDKLVRDLLDLERLRAGLLPMRLEPLDVAELVSAGARAVAGTARAAGVSVQVVPLRLARVSGDRERLAQAVTNLLANAVRFSPSGGQVEVTVGGSADRVRIQVRDQGRAPTDDELQSAFEARLGPSGDAPSRRGAGTGLLITRLIVQGHAGAVGVTRPTGGGAELWMELPVMSGANAEPRG